MARQLSRILILAIFLLPGFAHAVPVFHAILESNTDAGAGSEIFRVSYDSLADFDSNTFSSSGFSQLNINSQFSMAGFTYDGSQYHAILESNTDAGAGSEIFRVSYDSLADFDSNTFSSSGFSQLNINSQFSMAGFTYDGSQYHAILESDADAGAGSEIFRVSYDSLADFDSNTFSSSGFSQLNINSQFSMAGFAAVQPLNAVPIPSTLWLTIAPLLAFGLARQRPRKNVRNRSVGHRD